MKCSHLIQNSLGQVVIGNTLYVCTVFVCNYDDDLSVDPSLRRSNACNTKFWALGSLTGRELDLKKGPHDSGYATHGAVARE